LKRLGSNHKPYYRVVVADSERATTGKSLESLGIYDPLARDKSLRVDVAGVEAWRKKGATLSPSIARIVKRAAELQKA
jgi:small subunit ribosomal protein S16